MAAHIVVEYPLSNERTAFTGSSEEDVAYLKMFWKSIHLNPTIESRLVSSDVRQRLPPNPLKSHESLSSASSQTSTRNERQSFGHRDPDPEKLTDYHRNVFRLESEDQYKKRLQQLEKRDVNINRHKQRRDKREEIQHSAKQRSVKSEAWYQILPPITPDYNDDFDPVALAEYEARQTVQDIDTFEQQLSSRIQGKEPIDERGIEFD